MTAMLDLDRPAHHMIDDRVADFDGAEIDIAVGQHRRRTLAVEHQDLAVRRRPDERRPLTSGFNFPC